MKKLITIIFSLLSIATVILIIISINNANNYKEEEIYSVKRAYFYNENDDINLKLYSNSTDSFLLEYKDYEAYLEDEDENVIQIKPNNCYLDNVCLLEDKTVYQYNLQAKITGNDFYLDDCSLKLITETNIFRIKIGSLSYYNLGELKRIGDIKNLYGLSFDIPFTSIGAIYLNIDSDKDVKLNNVKLPDGTTLGVVKVNGSEDSVKVKDYYEYDYTAFNGEYEKNINKEDNTILLLLNYEDDILYDTFPILLDINGVSSYIDTFNYIKINDLNLVKSLINKGVNSGV